MAWFFLVNREEKELPMIVDTVVLEPDEHRFTVTSRASLPLTRNMFEIDLVVVGHDPMEKARILTDRAGSFPIVETFDDEAVEETVDD